MLEYYYIKIVCELTECEIGYTLNNLTNSCQCVGKLYLSSFVHSILILC